MENYLISIVIPVYNAEKYLRRCLDSVINQSYNHYEIILIDDGSSDNSGVICDEYASKDSRFMVIHKRNEGVSIARNIGIDHTKGEYITFLDADDYLEKCFFEKMIEYSMFPLVVCAYREFGCREMIKGPENDKEIIVARDIPILWNKSYSPYWLYIWGKLFRSTIIRRNKLLFDTEMRYLEDFCFVMKYISYIDRIYMTNNVLVNHLVESSKYTKYHMKFDELKIHIMKQDTCFTILEEKCGDQKFMLMRERIFNRHFFNFKNYIINDKAPFRIKCEEIMRYKSEEKSTPLHYVRKKGIKFELYYYMCRFIAYFIPHNWINN